jgi:hypothetical protein
MAIKVVDKTPIKVLRWATATGWIDSEDNEEDLAYADLLREDVGARSQTSIAGTMQLTFSDIGYRKSRN